MEVCIPKGWSLDFMVTLLIALSGSMLAPLVGVEPGFPSPDWAETRLTWKYSSNSGRSSSSMCRFKTCDIQKTDVRF